MSKTTSDSAGGKDVLRLLAKALSPYLQDELSTSTLTQPEYYSQKDSPLGRRKHMGLVRQGVLRGRKVGKSVFVLRNDVHAYIQAHDANAHTDVSSNELLNDWGLAPKGRR